MRDIHFGTDSLELLHKESVPGGRPLREKKTISVLGISIDTQGSILTAVSSREIAAQ